MLKRAMALLLAAACLWGAPALAEVYAGKTAALSTVAVCAGDDCVLDRVAVRAGQRVAAGEALASLRANRVYASQEGVVCLTCADVGDAVDGEVLEVAPLEQYTLCCTVDKAYQSAETTLVHSGEIVVIRCTRDGTHRAVGVVTQIEGSTYRVLTLGGELYVGETVYLYRAGQWAEAGLLPGGADLALAADFTASRRVGIGTVLVSDTQVYEAEGKLTLLRVAEGDWVERGQLLYETDGGTIEAPEAGIIASVSCQAGDALAAGQAVAELVPEGEIGVVVQVDEAAAARLSPGDAAELVFAGQEAEEAVGGTVIDVSGIGESGLYTVRLRPEEGQALALGMSVEVRL